MAWLHADASSKRLDEKYLISHRLQMPLATLAQLLPRVCLSYPICPNFGTLGSRRVSPICERQSVIYVGVIRPNTKGNHTVLPAALCNLHWASLHPAQFTFLNLIMLGKGDSAPDWTHTVLTAATG